MDLEEAMVWRRVVTVRRLLCVRNRMYHLSASVDLGTHFG